MSDDTSPLATIPSKWWTPDPSIVAKLPRGGSGDPRSCRECGGYHKPNAIHLSYVGHADLTRALIEIDPVWDWEPLAFNDDGLPRVIERNKQLILWGRMTLLGQTRLCVGTCDSNKSDAEKELIGDLLRNGGMRFGVFGSLWSKSSGWTDTPDDTPEEHSEAPSDVSDQSENRWQGGTRFPDRGGKAASPKQVKFASELLEKVVHVNRVAQYIEDTICRASPLEELSTAEMSKLIDKLQDDRKAGVTPETAYPAGEEPFA